MAALRSILDNRDHYEKKATSVQRDLKWSLPLNFHCSGNSYMCWCRPAGGSITQMTNSRYDITLAWGVSASREALPSEEHPWRNNCRERTWAGRSPWSCDSQSQCLPTAQIQTHKGKELKHIKMINKYPLFLLVNRITGYHLTYKHNGRMRSINNKILLS